MRFGQIFLTINMLMDHTASSPVLRQIEMATYAKPSELASQKPFESTGVVYTPTIQQYNQMMKEAAQVKAMVEKNYDPQSYLTNHGRQMQEMDGNDSSDDGLNIPMIIGGCAVGMGLFIAMLVCLKKYLKGSFRETIFGDS